MVRDALRFGKGRAPRWSREVLGCPGTAALLALSLIVCGLPASAAEADPPTTSASAWVPNGPVNAVARSETRSLYIGGAFDYVGPYTGHGAVFDAAGQPVNTPTVNGSVWAVTPDGSGGWYIGGAFSKVGGVERNNLAHVLSNGTVDPNWNPNVAGSVSGGAVRAIAVSGSTIYIAGFFTSVGGQTRQFLAQIDSNGNPTSWNPQPSSWQVYALAVSGSTIYVGGAWSSISGQANGGLAKIDSAGNVSSWDPDPNGTVYALAVSGSNVYVGGVFDSIGDSVRSTRKYVAQVDTTTGDATSWNPNANYNVFKLALSGSTVYVGGEFTSVGGQTRYRVAALDTSGNATSWNPTVDPGNPYTGCCTSSVYALTVSGSTVYIGGPFSTVGGQPRKRFAAIDSTGNVTGLAPKAGDNPRALAVSGSNVYIGGQFASIGGEGRNNLAEIDLKTGDATEWNPSADSTVKALAVSGSTLYAGGAFTTVGGQTRNRIAAIDATGTPTAWNPNASSDVETLAVSGSTVYAGGYFTSIGGQTRNRIAALGSSGSATSWNPTANGLVRTLGISGSTVYAGGDFTSIGAQPRSYLAAIDSLGNATSWNPSPDSSVNTLAISGSTVYAGGYFMLLGGQVRNFLGAVDSAGNATSWNPSPDSIVERVSATGSTVYASGQFSQIGVEKRAGLARIDSAGNATAWNPAVNTSTPALAAFGSTVYAGGSFGSAGGEEHPNLALFISAPTNTAAPAITGTPAAGQTLSVSRGSWDNDTLTFGYEWFRDGASIGVTDDTYTLTTQDKGHEISARVLGSNMAAGTTATSNTIVVDIEPSSTAAPQISGTVQEGHTLSGTNGGWQASPAPTFTYKWRRCDPGCTDIAGATAQTYALQAADVGKQIRLEVTATNRAGSATASSGLTTTVLAAPPANQALPTISGTARDEQTLTGADGTWSSSRPVSYSRQWRRCETADPGTCGDIAGETGQTYTLRPADVGKLIRFRVLASNEGGSTTADSAATATIAAAPPANHDAPTISGIVREAEPLTADPGGWNGTPPLEFEYRWLRCDSEGSLLCFEILGADENSYTPVNGDVGRWLRVQVTATNSAGTAVVRSQPVGPVLPLRPVNTSPPTVSGTAQQDEVLTAHNGDWTGGTPMDFAYQWLRCTGSDVASCSDISDATTATYTEAAEDVGKRLRVRVTATNSGGAGSAVSDLVGPVVAVPPSNSALPVISGIAKDKERLEVSDGTWLGSRPMTFAYQWFRCTSGTSCTAIPGATAVGYTLTASDIGFHIRAVVTAINAADSVPAQSALTGAVDAIPPINDDNDADPSITGEAVSEETLTANPGQWRGSDPMQFAYQWERCVLSCSSIEGATQPTYTLTFFDVATTVRVVVIATNPGGSSAPLPSPPTSTVLPGVPRHPPANGTPPTISGDARDGATLTASPGTWTGSQPMAFAYQWRRCHGETDCGDIAGAVASTYTATRDDIGWNLAVRVTATNPVASAEATSSSTAAIAAVAPRNSDPPRIVGSPRRGVPLAATTGTWSGTEPIEYTYRWLGCLPGGACATLPGGSGQSFTPGADECGLRLRVEVTATNVGGVGKASSAISDPVAC